MPIPSTTWDIPGAQKSFGTAVALITSFFRKRPYSGFSTSESERTIRSVPSVKQLKL